MMIFPHQPNGEPPLGGCDRLHSHHKVPIIQVPKRILIEFQKRILIELQKRILIELRNKQDTSSTIRSVRMGDCFLLSIVSFSVFHILFSICYFPFYIFGFLFLQFLVFRFCFSFSVVKISVVRLLFYLFSVFCFAFPVSTFCVSICFLFFVF